MFLSARVRFICLLGAGLVLALGAQGMALTVQGDTVFAAGPVEDDYLKFVEAFDHNPITRVVFVNSPGGEIWTGMRVGRLIAEKGLHTVVAGYCASACSIMFMGGKLRTFSDTFRPAFTYVGIHGPRYKLTNELAPQLGTQLYAFYKSQMGERFNATIMNQALYDMEDAGSLLRVFDAYRAPRRVSYHCRSEQTLRKDCTEFPGEDAYSLGVVTSVDLTSIALPDSLKTVARVAGTDLTVAVADPQTYYPEMALAHCTSERCKQVFAEFSTYRENKALAVPVQGMGYGVAYGADSPTLALLRSIYFCNRPATEGVFRLCEAQVVNGYDLRSLYADARLSHTQALAALQAPPQKFYGNEEYGGTFTRAKELRVQKVHDMTPSSLDGIRTVATQELALLLKSAQPPVLIDVWAGSEEAIPGSVVLIAGGVAYEEPAKEAEYAARFAGLLKLLSPDPARPVVFYCMSRDCWLSVNAAQRARKLGYTDVVWYRGGWVSWKAAGLPVAKLQIRAVVQ